MYHVSITLKNFAKPSCAQSHEITIECASPVTTIEAVVEQSPHLLKTEVKMYSHSPFEVAEELRYQSEDGTTISWSKTHLSKEFKGFMSVCEPKPKLDFLRELREMRYDVL